MNRKSLIVFQIALAAAVGGCVSPEAVRVRDQQRCAGFGFAPGTNAFATCMMNLGQQRDAQNAAMQRQQEHDQSVTAQGDKDRQAQQDAAAKAESDRRYQDWLRMSGHAPGAPTAPDIPEPTIP